MKVIKKIIITAVACSIYSIAGPASAQVTTISPNTPYYIKNVASGLVLNNEGSTANGTPISQWSFGSSGDDQWKPVLTNGFWHFVNLHSGLVINNPAGSTANG